MNLYNNIKRLWIARYKVDFRKSHDGLLGEAYRLGLEPFDGDAVIFIGRDKKRIKFLYADNNGLWVLYKRFNKGVHRMKFIFNNDKHVCGRLKLSEFSLFLDGASYTIHKSKKDFPIRK